MHDSVIPKIYKEINSDNYLVNCYKYIIRSKALHFLFILIELLLNIFQELETFIKDYDSKTVNKNLKYISIISILNKISISIKIVILIVFVISISLLYYFISKKTFRKKYISISIIINFLELFYFRTIMIIILNIFFSLSNTTFLLLCLMVVPHIYSIMNNFIYNHLYYFVPIFIEYPYDEFSSLFDTVLLFIKILLTISANTSNYSLGHFCFIIIILEQLFFSFYFIYILKNHSYLLMKNSFLNKTRLSLFFTMSSIILLELLFGKTEVISPLFLIVSIGLFFTIMSYIYLLYNPFNYIAVKRETPIENIFFYLYILSDENNLDFLFEKKINEHYDICGICNLCKKYSQCINNNNNIEEKDEEKEKLINVDKEKKNKNDKLIDLFDIIYDGKDKYFELIRNITLNYKIQGKKFFKNNSYYYINLSFLLYSDYQKNKITLSLNEKILLEVINRENKLIENHKSKINQIIFCNKFSVLSNKVINQLKEILKCEHNMIKARKLIDLSYLLKEMKDSKYKKNLFEHKQENISNSRNMITSCSIIYEEIFNTTLNNSQIPIRENIQPLEDIFYINTSKTNKIISLLVNLANNNCTIIRAGKDLSSYKNNYLFDLFPLIFKEYQINLFMTTIIDNFNKNMDKETNNNVKDNRVILKEASKNIKTTNLANSKNKTEYVELKIIICETISSKIYYKLLTLKLTPLFNIDYNNYFILFDGLVHVHKNTIITLKDFEESNNPKEILLAVSDPQLEELQEIYSMTFQKYSTWQNNRGFTVTPLTSFHLSNKLYNIYSVLPKGKDIFKKKMQHNLSTQTFNIEDEEGDNIKHTHRNTRMGKVIEDNASAASQQTMSTYGNSISGLGARNKKKDEILIYDKLNKIRKIMYMTMPIIFISFILEFLYIKILYNYFNNDNHSYIEFRDFYSLYFQLFSSVLGIACIHVDPGCKDLISIYSEQYNNNYGQKNGNFNFLLFVKGQNQVLTRKMMEKRNSLVNLHKNIGDKKYNELFGQTIIYYHVSQVFIQGNIGFTLAQIKVQFSDALLMICNSFQIISNTTSYDIIHLLNKIDDPFKHLNLEIENNEELTQYQKEIYEMILNFRSYRNQFYYINDKLFDLLTVKKNLIQLLLFIFLALDSVSLSIIAFLIYSYLSIFENILMKILNYVNMTINIKNDNFNFSSTFSEKLENLEIILEIYNGDPVKAVKKLNTIYSEYQQYLINKNKSNANSISKKNYRKTSNADEEKKEMENIPKNQRIVTKKDIRDLKIVNCYFYSLIILILYFVITFSVIIYCWVLHFKANKNLARLIQKNTSLESTLYTAINIYDLMIFHNYTIDELAQIIFNKPNNSENNKKTLLKSFYEDLTYAFNKRKEIKDLSNFYADVIDPLNFTCEELFNMDAERLDYITENPIMKENSSHVEQSLINLCKNMRIDESHEIVAAFQYYLQNVKNEIVNINDFSEKGLDEQINSGTLGKITAFFDCILIHVKYLANDIPQRNAIDKLYKIFNLNITITAIIYIVIDFLIIVVVFFLYIFFVNSYCNQIFLLKKIFTIFEIQEQ